MTATRPGRPGGMTVGTAANSFHRHSRIKEFLKDGRERP
jgi:hypothetical protein